MADESRDNPSPPQNAGTPVPGKNGMLVLDHVRPTVVVRRRVYEVEKAPPVIQTVEVSGPEEDLDNGPPSSINVARALASLRADELARVEELVRRDDDDEGLDEDDDPEAFELTAEISVPPLDSVPVVSETRRTVALGKEITVKELARRMELDHDELVMSLVSNGFFSITPKSTLPRETAKVAASIFGFHVAEGEEPEIEPASRERQSNGRLKAKPKAKAR